MKSLTTKNVKQFANIKTETMGTSVTKLEESDKLKEEETVNKETAIKRQNISGEIN